MKKIFSLCCLLFFNEVVFAQNHVLVGYWHNWNDQNANYIQLDQVDSKYDIIEVAFAMPASLTDMTMMFNPDGVSQNTFISKIKTLQNKGKKVILSIGGETTAIDLTTNTNKILFINSIINLINLYGFDGIDIDIENGNSVLVNGTILLPNIAILNLIDAIKAIMVNYSTTNSKKLFLTITPQTANVQGGKSGFGNVWGSYLPIIHALRDSIDLLQVQLYNSGSMIGADNSLYFQGTIDFIVSMTEMIIKGFQTNGGKFTGIPANKITVCLPACTNASSGGFVDTMSVRMAMNYLLGKGFKFGNYELLQKGGYPDLAGMTTWSINWDKNQNYSYAKNFEKIFETNSPNSVFVEDVSWGNVYPNPVIDFLFIEAKNKSLIKIYKSDGMLVDSIVTNNESTVVDFSRLTSGFYLLNYQNKFKKILKL